MTAVRSIVNDVITQLSMVGTYATQKYATPRIQQHVQDACIMLMDEAWWPHLTKYFRGSLDGITGTLTADLTVAGYANHSVQRYQDIQFVMIDGTEQRLLRLPTNINPFNLTGGNAMFIDASGANSARPFTVWPLTATDDLVIRAKLYPTIPISDNDVVYLDSLCVTYAAAYFYAQDDGTNPGAIDKFEKLLEKRLTQAKKGYEHQPIPLGGPSFGGIGQWQEAPWG